MNRIKLLTETTESRRAGYRPDIDGLRAVAVLLVVCNHLNIRFLGGYVGVDIFFVISGYLISGHILSKMSDGTFSFSDFYERRVRRILPALLAMLLLVAIPAYRYLLPSELVAYGWSSLAALASVSNILFWTQAGYFDAPSASKPLLHTWSLGVEEQFYLLFPLLLFLTIRWFRTHFRLVLCTAAALSLLLACLWVRRDASAAFFLLPLRAWELLVGTIVSQRYLPPLTSRIAREVAGWAGLIAIFAASLLYSEYTPFPGLTAVLPCVGAALIIAAGETGVNSAARLLSLKPVVFIGAISYSLYLWHWPLLVFQNTSQMLVESPPNRLMKAVVFAASLLAAILSWRFVETPFRYGRWRPGRRLLCAWTGAGVLAVAAVAITLIAVKGAPFRMSAESVRIGSYTDHPHSKKGVCFITPPQTFAAYRPEICLATQPGRKTYLLIGDSFADALYPGLSQVYPEINLLEATAASCRPILPTPEIPPDQVQNCKDLAEFMFKKYLRTHHPDGILLAGGWQPRDLPDLGREIADLEQQGLAVTLFGPPVTFDAPLLRLLVHAMQLNKPESLSDHLVVTNRLLDTRMAALAKDEWKIPFISQYADLCSPATLQLEHTQWVAAGCPVLASGAPLAADAHHLTTEGSLRLAQVIRAQSQLVP